jgi:hypothetical protein
LESIERSQGIYFIKETQLENIPANIAKIDDITSRLATEKQTFDMDSPFYVHRSSLQQEQRTH